jgi:heat shock protein HslJ
LQGFCIVILITSIIQNMKYIKFIIFALFILSQNSLLGQEPVKKTLIVADAKVACIHENTIMACYKVKTHQDSIWREFPYQIDGFLFEQGFETIIEVLETNMMFPGDSVYKLNYKFIREIKKTNRLITDIRILSNNQWKILNHENYGTLTPLKKANASISFNIKENQVNGFSGCNQIGGNAQFEDGVINFGSLVSTKMACDNMELENLITGVLTGKAAFYVRNNILFIVGENNSLLHLRPGKRLDSIIQVINTPKSPFDGNTYFLLKDGKYQIKMDEIESTNRQMMIFNKTATLTEVEKKSNILIKLVNVNKESDIVQINILKLAHASNNTKYADVIFKDGTKKRILIQEVI